MTKDSYDLPALPPGALALLDAEQAREGAPAAARERLFSRLEAQIPGLGGGEGGGAAKSESGGDATPSAQPGAATPANVSAPVASLPLGKAIAIGALGLAVGGALGAVVDRSIFPPAPRVVVVEKRIEVPASVPPVASAEIAPTAISPGALPDVPRAALKAQQGVKPSSTSASSSANASSANDRDTELAEERLAIEAARTALARGDANGALAAADRHRARHPRGQLAEEREAVAIQALAALGRRREAAERLAAFNQTYPKSMILPIVEQAIHGSP